MRRTIALLFAIVLVMGMTQCKKKADTIANVGGEKIQITLDVDGGKHEINPGTSGQVAYETGDVIYVGDGSHFIGTLTHDGTKFTGGVSKPSGSYLYFYFIGGFDPSVTPVQGTTTLFTVDISDQSSKLPVLSYASVSYVPGQSAYTCMLENKCALVNFKLTQGTSSAVTLNGMLTTATINFATPGITPEASTGGITLNSTSETSKWAILLPTAGATATKVTIGGTSFDVTVPVIIANGYLHDATAIEINNATPAGDYVFTVDDGGTTVHFSPGNLQYKEGTGWRFAQHQYDAIGSWNTSDWVDLFGWGTWGSGQNPLNESENGLDYEWSTDFQGTLDGHNDWRTLTKDEWQYIFDHSTNGWSTVAGVNGYVLHPDGNTTAVASSYTADEWAAAEASGSVFLPAAGSRYGTDVYDVGGNGSCWSSTNRGVKRAWNVFFDEDGALVGDDERLIGCSVRLVR